MRTFVTIVEGLGGSKPFRLEEVFVENGFEEARMSCMNSLGAEIKSGNVGCPISIRKLLIEEKIR